MSKKKYIRIAFFVMACGLIISCIDPANPPKSSIAYREKQFFSLLHEGYSLLDRNEFGAAEKAFIKADKIYPKDPYYGSIVAEHLLEIDYLSKTPEQFENYGCR